MSDQSQKLALADSVAVNVLMGIAPEVMLPVTLGVIFPVRFVPQHFVPE
jgi:hypothetical protein